MPIDWRLGCEQFVLDKRHKEGSMAISGKYGKVEIPKIGAEEPVFILRAQDKLAETAVEMYRLLAASHGSGLVDDLKEQVEAFRTWKGTKKIPD